MKISHNENVHNPRHLASVNRQVAVTPPVKRPIEAKGRGTGFVTMANKNRLVGLEVVYASEDLHAGQVVFFREADTHVSPEFSQVFRAPKLDDNGAPLPDEKNDNPDFVLVSEDKIVLVETYPYEPHVDVQQPAYGPGEEPPF